MTANQDTKTRADELRHRRYEQTTPRMTVPAARPARTNRAASQATGAPAAMARPVVVRNTTFGTPIHRQAATPNPRRQYYVALSAAAPGTELRLPAMPVIHWGWRTLSGAMVFALLVLVGSLLWSPFFMVNTIQIEGINRLDAGEIEAIADLENLSIVEVNAKLVRDDLTKTFPGIEKVVVSVGLPNAVGITITEREPAIAWRLGEETQWIDAEGVIFPAQGEAGPLLTIHSQDNPPLAAPVVTPEMEKAAAETEEGKAALAAALANPDPKIIDPALLVTAQKLVALLPEGTALAYSQSDGLGWQDPNGMFVYIGSSLEDFDAKFAMYQQIATEMSNRGLQPALISVEYLNNPYLKMEQ